MIKRCGLLGLVLENVIGITYETGGREAVVLRFLRLMQELCPEFVFKVDILKIIDYMFPQTRVRVFLRGFRKCISEAVPPTLPGFGRQGLRSLLGKFPNTPRSHLSELQQDNLKQIETRLSKLSQCAYANPPTYVHMR